MAFKTNKKKKETVIDQKKKKKKARVWTASYATIWSQYCQPMTKRTHNKRNKDSDSLDERQETLLKADTWMVGKWVTCNMTHRHIKDPTLPGRLINI